MEITLSNVDADLLERQRKTLNEMRPEVRAELPPSQRDALDGILNMLDAWSDELAERADIT